MLILLLFLFIAVPLVEIFLLIRVAHMISIVPTLALVVVTGIVGAALARREGTKTWTRVQADLAAGRMPASEIIDALLILVAGVLLVTPGIITDVFGFSLLIPSVRNTYKTKVAAYLRSRIVTIHNQGDDSIIDVEVMDVRDLEDRSTLP